MEEKLNASIREQAEMVKALEQELDAMPEGLVVDTERIAVDTLTKEVADTFVERVIVKPGRQVEIEWKFGR